MKQSELFQTAVKKAKAGERKQARDMLIQLVGQNPQHELAWLWLSELVANPEDKIIALENALSINPQRSQTKERLHRLRQKYAKPSQPATSGFGPNGHAHTFALTTEEVQFGEINQLLAAGSVEQGRQQLANFLQRYSNHEAGWELMVHHADSQKNLLIALDHLLRLNTAHSEAPQWLARVKPTKDDFLQMGRIYERLENWELAVHYYKRALKSPINADRLLAKKRLPHVQEQLKLANITYTSPTATVLRLALGPTVLYAMLMLIQAGLKPTQTPPLLCLGSVLFLVGMVLFSALSHAPEHPWLQRLRDTAVFQSNITMRLVSIFLILLPLLLLLLVTLSRLLNFELDLTNL